MAQKPFFPHLAPFSYTQNTTEIEVSFQLPASNLKAQDFKPNGISVQKRHILALPKGFEEPFVNVLLLDNVKTQAIEWYIETGNLVLSLRKSLQNRIWPYLFISPLTDKYKRKSVSYAPVPSEISEIIRKDIEQTLEKFQFFRKQFSDQFLNEIAVSFETSETGKIGVKLNEIPMEQTPEQTAKADELYGRAVQNHLNFQLQEALRLYTEAAKAGSGDALVALGDMYSEEEAAAHGMIPNAEKSRFYMIQAALMHEEIRAMSALFTPFLAGKESKAITKEQARVLLTMSAISGEASSMLELGRVYWKGTLDTTQDYERAYEWFRLAFLRGSPLAAYHLAIFHRDGVHVQKSYATALQYAQLAKYWSGSEEFNAFISTLMVMLKEQGTPSPSSFSKSPFADSSDNLLDDGADKILDDVLGMKAPETSNDDEYEDVEDEEENVMHEDEEEEDSERNDALAKALALMPSTKPAQTTQSTPQSNSYVVEEDDEEAEEAAEAEESVEPSWGWKVGEWALTAGALAGITALIAKSLHK